MATLYALTTTCVGLFADLISHLEKGSEEHRNSISIAKVENEASRLKVWAGNLGALRTGHASLDHRLRDSTTVRNAIVRTLDKMADTLKISCLIVKGDRAPLKDAMRDYSDVDEHDDAADSDDSSSNCSIESELAFNLAEITDMLSELHRLSFRIRNPGTRAAAESALKARLHREKDPHSGEDVFEQYAREDRLRIQGLVADFHLQYGHGLDHASDYLIKRASMANTTRRRCFSYWQAHSSKLARVSTKPEVALPTSRPADQSVPRTEVLLEAPAPSVVPSNVVSEQKTATSATEATTFAPNLDTNWDLKSQFSNTSTQYDTMGVYSHPPPPHIPSEAREHTCPYCHLTCPVRHFKGQAWRKHVLQDFQPYFCTYEECPEPTALYADRIAWKEHERLVHRRVWRCFEHPNVFGTQLTVHHHLVESHQELTPPQIQTLLDMAIWERPDERSRCPLCGSDKSPEADFADHLACHMEKFAMIASPLGYDGDENPHGSGSDVAISDAADSRLSLSSLSSFNSLVSETPQNDVSAPDAMTGSPAEDAHLIGDFERLLQQCTRTSVIRDDPFVLHRRLFEWYHTFSEEGGEPHAIRLLKLFRLINHDMITAMQNSMRELHKVISLKVLTILTQLGKRLYIVSFWRLGILDSHLPLTPKQLRKIWDEEGTTAEESAQLTRDFLKLQGQLCTSITGEHLEPCDDDDDTILPVTKISEPIAGSTYKVDVPDECFEPAVKEMTIRSNVYNRVDIELYRQFALTIWNNKSQVDGYKLTAYKVIEDARKKNTQDFPFVIRCYGVWWINGSTYILRDWGHSTLEDLFNTPSYLDTPRDFRRVWKSLLMVTTKNTHIQGYRWHYNINPSTVFYITATGTPGVLPMWVLGDVEAADTRKWSERKEQIPFTASRPDSIAYGGPELSRPNAELNQGFDMWSLGCVFSEVATWAILEKEGIAEYRSRRASLSPSGCFHDGTNVSPIVLEWHNHLRTSTKSDSLTIDILDYVEKDLLLGDPAKRGFLGELWREVLKVDESN